jgi:serine/threonine-protein kinase
MATPARAVVSRLRLPGIAGRVFLFTAAIVGAVLVVALIIASRTGRRSARDAERHGLEQAADLAAQLLAFRARTLAGGARVFVQGPYFRALVAERRRDDITDQAFEAQDQLAADWVFITDERGILLAKSDEPGVQGVSMAEFPLVAGALEGRTMSGYGVSRDTVLFQAVALPIVVPGAAPVGVLVATKVIDSSIVRDIRATTGAEIVFYTIAARGTAHVAATSLASHDAARAALPPAGVSPPSSSGSTAREAARTTTIGGATFALQGGALTTAGGDIVGGYVVGRPRESTPTQIAGVRRSLLLAGLLGLALALAAAWSAARHVTRPARELAEAAGHALEGDYEAAARIAGTANRPGSPPTEIAVLSNALGSLLEELREKHALIALLDRAVAGGSAVARVSGEHEITGERAAPRGRVSGRVRAQGSVAAQSAVAQLSAYPASLSPGALVAARYRLEEVIGAGGTGVVYRATDLTLHETVALKMLRPDLVAAAPRAQDELKHELRLARRVSHRNVVRTHDFGTSDGMAFITMEFVEGTPLSTVLAQRGALPSGVVAALAKQLVRALEAAHEQGIVHGDLKPANLLVAGDGLLKVTDFGVATLVRRPQTGSEERVTPPHLAGAVVGTPEYMAPELLVGGEPDARSDLYAAGMVLYECLSGATPFQRDTPRGFLSQKLDVGSRSGQPPRSPAPGGSTPPQSLEALVAWMTAPNSADRPPSAAAVAAVLARLR